VEGVSPAREDEGAVVSKTAGLGEGGDDETAVAVGEAPGGGCGGTWSRWMMPWGPVLRDFLEREKLLRVGLGCSEPEAFDNRVREKCLTGQMILGAIENPESLLATELFFLLRPR